MARKNVKKPVQPSSSRTGPRQAAYPVEQRELERQQQRIRQAAAAGATSLRLSAAAQPPTPASGLETPLPVNPATVPAPVPEPPPRTVQTLETKTVPVTFVFSSTTCSQVSVCGEFNDWTPGATPMYRREQGYWEATIYLTPGRYQYKFVVDNEWIPDPNANESAWNQYGSCNSVLQVHP